MIDFEIFFGHKEEPVLHKTIITFIIFIFVTTYHHHHHFIHPKKTA